MTEKIKPPARAIWQLLTYLAVGILPTLFVLPILIFSAEKFKLFMLRIDVAVCVIAHGKFDTLSGLTGDGARDGKARYKIQAKVIDLLAYPFEREWKHCDRASYWTVTEASLDI